MKISQAIPATIVLVALALIVGCNGRSSSPSATETATVTVTTKAKPAETVTVTVPNALPAAALGPAPPKHRLEFGHIRSLVRFGDGFKLRFDPAEFATGVTANDSALQDTGSNDVPNDNYVVDESHRLYSYLVPADAHVTVLAAGVEGTPITVAQLAKLVKGENPL